MFVSFRLQLASALPPDRHTHPAGDARLHANALRHVLQRVDLPGGHRGIRLGLLFYFSSPESYLRIDEGMENIHFNSQRTLDEEQWETFYIS